MNQVYAAADIGSNTAHLLVAASDGKLVMRIDNYNEWIPLGEVVARQGQIPKEIEDELVAAIRGFQKTARENKAVSLYVFATEAVRAARNHNQVLKRILDETGVKVAIIDPQREAFLSFRGSALDCRHLHSDVMLEVGGGSAQLAVIGRSQIVQEESLLLGTGRVIAESGIIYPCPDYAFEAAQNYIDATLEGSQIDHRAKRVVVCGGVARGLWRALHPDGEKVLSMEEIEYLVWSTGRLSIDRIIARFGVKAKRAGTLLPGSLVYRALMKKFGAQQIAVSEFGVREGAILEMAQGAIA
jgi:exopolyphosphatase/guanosine-5'-triphosphate,3'-diphosphate pyrophosphatase